MTLSRRTFSEEKTRELAREFGAGLRRGDVVALFGDLGSGKTQFVKGLCAAFKVSETVSSPTFVILHRYEGQDRDGQELLIHHFDLYRVRSAWEIYDLGYEEFLFGDGLCVVEWADRLHDLLPADRHDVRIGFGSRENERSFEIVPVRSGISPGGDTDDSSGD